MSTNIYILRLENGKYYVGKSDNPMRRYQEHLNGKASAWTKKYKPIAVEKIIENASHFDEDKYTKEYMAKYGIKNVRGGSYVEIILDDFQEETLNREIWGAQNKCSRCGRSGHFVKDCFANVDVNGYELNDDSASEEEVWCCEKCNKEFDSEKAAINHEKYCNKQKPKNIIHNDYKTYSNNCYRCGCKEHFASNCFAQKDVDGNYLDSDSDFSD